METFDERKKKETEQAKIKFEMTKTKIGEITSRSAKVQAEHQEMKTKWEKKLNELRNIGADQNIKMTKLNKDLENFKTLLQPRKAEENNLRNMNNALAEEYSSVKENLVSSNIEFSKTLEELDRRVKEAYVTLEQAKDFEDMCEMGLDSLTDEERILFVRDVERKKKEREEKLNFELTSIESSEKKVKEDFRIKTEQLEALKAKHSDLNKKYLMCKNLKEEVKQ